MHIDDKTKKIIGRLLLFLILGTAIFLAVKNDYGLYSADIGTVTAVSSTLADSKTGYDGTYEYEEDYYLQKLTIRMRNGQSKGKTLYAESTYAKSGVYDTKYTKGDDVFVENINTASVGWADLTGTVTGTKRDSYAVLVLVLLFGLFLAVGGKEGALTILSLALNIAAFYVVLLLCLKGYNILFMTIPMAIFFTAMLLFFMYGRNQKTLISFAATVVSVAITTGIAALVLHFSGSVDYDFMDYLVQPYEQIDANYIFISEILIGSMGAVMDIVVTIVMTVDQILENAPDTDAKALLKSCRNVGDDVVGTMVSIMFFSNIAAAIPFIILSMRNGIGFMTILRYNSFFELARFLTGSIGVVLSIPVASVLSIYCYKKLRRRVKSC